MKKNGFTLAEVLITLAIIGVVATMTLPALMTNTQEQQAKTGLRKAINTLTEAAQMHSSIDGYSFSGFQVAADIDDEEADNTFSMEALLRARTAIDFTKTGNQEFDVETVGNAVGASSVIGNNATYVHFRDGSVLIYDPNNVIAIDDNAELQDDGQPLGYIVAIDTNGTKGPNQLSNCQGNALGADETQQNALVNYADLDATCAKGNRAIKDQFLLRLRGTVVQPEGPAAVWAFNN